MLVKAVLREVGVRAAAPVLLCVPPPMRREDCATVGSECRGEAQVEERKRIDVLRDFRLLSEVSHIFGPYAMHVVIEELLRDVNALGKRRNKRCLLVGDVGSRKRNRSSFTDSGEDAGTFVN